MGILALLGENPAVIVITLTLILAALLSLVLNGSGSGQTKSTGKALDAKAFESEIDDEGWAEDGEVDEDDEVDEKPGANSISISNLAPAAAARLAKLNAEIEKLSDRIEPLPRYVDQMVAWQRNAEEVQPPGTEATRRLMFEKIRGGMVQERQEIFEEGRVQDVIREAKEMGWDPNYNESLGDCPACSKKSPDGQRIGATLVCCGKLVCIQCRDNIVGRLLLTCPMCQQDNPVSKEQLNERTMLQAKNGKPWAQRMAALQSEEAGDWHSAFHWYRLAAEQGNAEAQFHMGLFHMEGLVGLPKSDAEAKKFFLESAKQGFATAQYNLGVMLLNESLIDRSSQASRSKAIEAVRLVTLSAAQMSNRRSLAITKLGDMHALGTGGLEQSLGRALYWYKKTAKDGADDAQFNLGQCLLKIAEGQYGSDNIVGFSALPKAAYWIRKSADQGNTNAKKMLDDLERVAKSRCGGCLKPFGSDKAIMHWRCRIVFYCSKECQTDHWHKGHKGDCLEKSMLKK